MNRQELRAIALIVKKLGWNDMPATIALEAIQRMVNNDMAVGADCCGVIDDPEDSLLSIALWDVDKIWMSLFISDYESLHDEALRHWALTYRKDIENNMKQGILFVDACEEYPIPSKEWEWEHYQNYLDEMREAYDETIYSLKYSFN